MSAVVQVVVQTEAVVEAKAAQLGEAAEVVVEVVEVEEVVYAVGEADAVVEAQAAAVEAVEVTPYLECPQLHQYAKTLLGRVCRQG